MDFVAKKAFKAKVKRFGDDLGVNDLFSSSGNGGPSSSSTGNVFNTGGGGGSSPDSTDDLFPSSVAVFFDGQRGNFPTLCFCIPLNIFWIDRSILSLRANACMAWVHRLFHTMTFLCVFNVVTRTLATILLPAAFSWVFIIVSVAAGLMLIGFQVVIYDIAFRGLYRSSARLRGGYMGLCAVTAGIAVTYAFAGGAWFNGWMRLRMFSENDGGEEGDGDVFDGEKGYKRSLLLVCNVCEAIGWTFGFGLAVFTLFEMYHVYRERVQGLSEQALRDARRGGRGGGGGDEEEGGGGGGSGARESGDGGWTGAAGRDPRIAAIREQYGVRG